MSTQSSWLKDKDVHIHYPTLPHDTQTEIVIIGGGITGITTAYYLAKAGKQVILLEQGELLGGDTGHTTAFFTYLIDAPLTELKNTFGEEQARSVWKSNQDIIDEVERLVQGERIECEFARCNGYIFAHDEEGRRALKEEEALASSLGFPISWREEHLPFSHHGYILAPTQAKLHPVKYLQALAQKAQSAGAHIFEHTHVHTLDGNGPIKITTSHGIVMAEEVVVATHGPVSHPVQFPSRLKASRTYVIAATVTKDTLPEGIYWNTETPYHYFRVDRNADHDRIIMGGEDHPTGQSDVSEEEHFQRLEDYFRKLLRDTPFESTNRWSGQIHETIDGLPYIGSPLGQEHYHIATGYAGNGMTFGTMAAKILSAHILKEEHPWAELYKTLRPHGIGPFLRQGANFIQELIQGKSHTDEGTIDDIAPGSGKILLEDGQPVAVFKNPQGKIIKYSAICTHLRCTVQWNAAETSWDCPCHGSRFNTEGKVLNGPAIKPLEQLT